MLSLFKSYKVEKIPSQMDQIPYFNQVLKLKLDMTVDEYCHTEETQLLKPFFSEIWALKYDEEPDYIKK